MKITDSLSILFTQIRPGGLNLAATAVIHGALPVLEWLFKNANELFIDDAKRSFDHAQESLLEQLARLFRQHEVLSWLKSIDSSHHNGSIMAEYCAL